MKKVKIEVCVESMHSALIAQQQGADRVELCAALTEGGITPSIGMVQRVTSRLQIGVNVIIRPRRGDFCYSDEEFECMKQDIAALRPYGVGFVFGLLTPAGEIDLERTRQLVELARPATVTIHRAFDAARDPFDALEACIASGVDRILTSGMQTLAIEGVALLQKLVRQAAGRISIMPGSGVNSDNIVFIVSQTGCEEIHLSAKARSSGAMTYRKKEVPMSNSSPLSEYELEQTSPELLGRAVAKVRDWEMSR